MSNYILGTAGHVDHGKTALIKALTGIDTDRLAEEKKRGLTIDLGFASMKIEGVGDVGIVDVPGHERFLGNMLAGASGMDAVMLVIAAGEGVMPQTLEHARILTLLNVEKTVIALNKIDLLQGDGYSERILHVKEAIREELKDTVFADSPIIEVSAADSTGLNELKQCIAEMLSNDADSEYDSGNFMMHVDRSFTVKGFGTVVTGSVREGTVRVGEICTLYPSGHNLTVRNLQVSGRNTDAVSKGQRAAVNLKDISKDDIGRGCILAARASMTHSLYCDVSVRVLCDSEYSLNNNDRVRFYYGSGGYVARTVIVDKDVLNKGESGYAQLQFSEKISVREGDYYILRRMNEGTIIGGGRIIDCCPSRLKRSCKDNYRSFTIRESSDRLEKTFEKIRSHGQALATVGELKDDASVTELVADGRVIVPDGRHIIEVNRECLMREKFLDDLRNFHAKYPDRAGMPLKEAKDRICGSGRDRDSKVLLDYWIEKRYIKEAGAGICLYEYSPSMLEDDEWIRERISDIYGNAGIDIPAYNDVKLLFKTSERFVSVFKNLVHEGMLVKLDERYYIGRATLDWAYQRLVKMSDHVTDGIIILGDYRDRIKSSRKVALALLEYFDSKHLTFKTGEGRRINELAVAKYCDDL